MIGFASNFPFHHNTYVGEYVENHVLWVNMLYCFSARVPNVDLT